MTEMQTILSQSVSQSANSDAAPFSCQAETWGNCALFAFETEYNIRDG